MHGATEMSDDVATIRSRLVDPRRLCEALNLLDGAVKQASGGLTVRCPAHGDRSASCSVTVGPDRTIRVSCFGCALKGDVFALIAAVERLDCKTDFRRVLERAAQIAGVQLSVGRRGGDVSNPNWTSKPLAPPPANFSRVAAAFLALCPLSEPAKAYLAKRGVLDGAIADGWGALPANLPALRDAILALCPREDLLASRLYVERNGELRLVWHEHVLVIPYRDAEGQLVSLQRRRITPTTDPKQPKYAHAGQRGALYGVEKLSGNLPIAYAEGALDVLALRELAALQGRPMDVVGVQGTQAWSSAAAELARGRVALVATDADPFDDVKGQPGPGDAAAEAWTRDLRKAGASEVRRLRPEGGKDWCELTEQLAREPDAVADLWDETVLAAPIIPDPLWAELSRHAEEARERGLVPELDSAAIAKVKGILAGIDARRPPTYLLGSAAAHTLALLDALPDVSIPTGCPTLDSITDGGLRSGRLHMLAGEPNLGKTSVAVMMARHMAVEGYLVVFHVADVDDRRGILCRVAQAHGLDRRAFLSHDTETILEAARILEDHYPLLHVIDEAADGRSVLDAAEAALLRGATLGVRPVLFVDSLQTVRLPGQQPRDPKERLDEVIRALTAFTRRGLTIICTCEVPRSVYSGPKRSKFAQAAPPALAAFKGSGNIEYALWTGLVLTRIRGDVEAVRVEVPKNKQGREGVTFRLVRTESRVGYDDCGEMHESADGGDIPPTRFAEAPWLGALVNRARETLVRNPGLSGRVSWAALIGGSTPRARTAIARLFELGEVDERRTGRIVEIFHRNKAS